MQGLIQDLRYGLRMLIKSLCGGRSGPVRNNFSRGLHPGMASNPRRSAGGVEIRIGDLMEMI